MFSQVISKTFSNVLHRVSSSVLPSTSEEKRVPKVEGGKEARRKSKDKSVVPEGEWVDQHALHIELYVPEKVLYRKTSCISRTKSQNLNVYRPVLQLSLPNPLKPDVKSSMKM